MTCPEYRDLDLDGTINSLAKGPSRVFVNDVIAAGPGFVAVGSDRRGAAGWWSGDGTSWTRVAQDWGVFGDPDGDLSIHMNGVAAGGSGLVGVGELGGEPAIWWSTDGHIWEVARYDDAVFGTDPGRADAIEAAPGGPVVVARVGWDGPATDAAGRYIQDPRLMGVADIP